VETQIDDWASMYMPQWPELFNKQLECYRKENVDWRQVAREKVFPYLDDRLPAMRAARQNLLGSCAPVYARAQEALGFESSVVFVIYVGIGCGAGWATSFQDTPAVLFGLENIAECGWSDSGSIAGLIAHEIGHLVHKQWRAQHGRGTGSGPWWQLYSEGFAQRCEHIILGRDTWHQAMGLNDPDWLEWCHDRKAWLAAEFMRRANDAESIRRFFGSWFDIQGRKECGYFLGHALIKEMEKSLSMDDIASVDNIEEQCRRFLKNLAEKNT